MNIRAKEIFVYAKKWGKNEECCSPLLNAPFLAIKFCAFGE
ncbi:hypothetical protein ACFW04_002006 [Cataglyphis niger]